MPPTLRHVIDQFVKSDGTTPESGLLRFYPTPALRFADAPAGPTVGMSKVDVTLDGAGKIAGDSGLPLVCNDSTGVVDTHTVWIVEFHLDNLSRDAPRVAWFTLSITDPDPVRLATILRLDPAPTPAAQYVLASVFAAHVAATLHTGAHGGLDGIVGTAGAAGQVPTSDGAGGAVWGTGGGGGSGLPLFRFQFVDNADLLMDGTSNFVVVRPRDRACTVTLPPAASMAGQQVVVYYDDRGDGPTIFVQPHSGDSLDYLWSPELKAINEFNVLVSDGGTTWHLTSMVPSQMFNGGAGVLRINAGGYTSSLPYGSAGQNLRSTGGGAAWGWAVPVWETLAYLGGGDTPYTVAAGTVSTLFLFRDLTADFTLNLPALGLIPSVPAVPVLGLKLLALNGHTVALVPNGSDQIDGLSGPYALTTDRAGYLLIPTYVGTWVLI